MLFTYDYYYVEVFFLWFLFLALLGLPCCMGFSVAVRASHCRGFSWSTGMQASSWGSWALEHGRNSWGIQAHVVCVSCGISSRPGIEPVSALVYVASWCIILSMCC